MSAVALWRRPRPALRRVALRWLPIAAAVDLLLVVAFRTLSGIHDHLPPSFQLWIGLVVFAVVVAVGSRTSTRRLLALGAIALAAMNAFVQINGHYGYFPTVGTVLGRPSPEVVTTVHLQQETAMWPTPPSTLPSHGQLAPLDVAPTASGFRHRPGSVWLPPAYFDSRRDSLPVVLMLSGAPGSPIAWPRAGFAIRTAEQYAAAHNGMAPILIFTDQNGSPVGDTECVDGPRGKAETFLTVDVMAFVHDQLHVHPTPQHTAVIGFSEGGTCALELALRHPDVFGTFVDMAGDAAPTMGPTGRTLRVIYGGDRLAMRMHDPTVLLAAHAYPGLQGWFLTGRHDLRHVKVDSLVAGEVRAAHIPANYSVIPGAHDWQFAARALRLVFPIVSSRISTA